MTKTVKEIEDLKEGWLNESCWDLETTEGFEEHREELHAYRLKIEAERKRIQAERKRKHDQWLATMEERKIIQIAVTVVAKDDNGRLEDIHHTALCDDGTMWSKWNDDAWHQMLNVPMRKKATV